MSPHPLGGLTQEGVPDVRRDEGAAKKKEAGLNPHNPRGLPQDAFREVKKAPNFLSPKTPDSRKREKVSGKAEKTAGDAKRENEWTAKRKKARKVCEKPENH